MKTSSFLFVKGNGRISIARYAPRHTPAGFRCYRKLAPGIWFNKVPKQQYYELFDKEILAPLNPIQVYSDLCFMAAPYEPILLCWEDLRAEGVWCHRRHVAEWLEKGCGIVIPEIEVSPTDVPIRRIGAGSKC